MIRGAMALATFAGVAAALVLAAATGPGIAQDWCQWVIAQGAAPTTPGAYMAASQNLAQGDAR